MLRESSLVFSVLAVVLLATPDASADDPASNRVHVKSGTWGRCYAKAVPEGDDGQKGHTTVFRVGKDADVKMISYPWYAQELDLQCNMVGPTGAQGLSIVQRGPWIGGRDPNASVVAVRFYFGPKKVAQYTYAQLTEGVKPGARHAPRVSKMRGYRWIDSNDYAFDIETEDGVIHSFNPVTGKRLPPAKKGK